jgi:hypothetical protein
MGVSVSVSGQRTGWRPSEVGRKKYFIFAGLIVVLIALMPLSFAFGAGPAAAWLLLFTARIRDIGRQVWAIPALLLVALEMFTKETANAISGHFGRESSGYFLIALFLTHVVFAVALGLQRSKPRSTSNP